MINELHCNFLDYALRSEPRIPNKKLRISTKSGNIYTFLKVFIIVRNPDGNVFLQ